MIFELLDELRGDEGTSGEELRRTRLATAMARMGSYVVPGDAKAVMDALEACGNPAFTPSGNPVMKVLSEEEIAKLL